MRKYDSWLYEGFGTQQVGLTSMASPSRDCGVVFVCVGVFCLCVLVGGLWVFGFCLFGGFHLCGFVLFLNVITLKNEEVWRC